jgi:hypothetical protein
MKHTTATKIPTNGGSHHRPIHPHEHDDLNENDLCGPYENDIPQQ